MNKEKALKNQGLEFREDIVDTGGIGMICSQRQKIKLKCEFLEENVDNFSETCL